MENQQAKKVTVQVAVGSFPLSYYSRQYILKKYKDQSHKLSDWKKLFKNDKLL